MSYRAPPYSVKWAGRLRVVAIIWLGFAIRLVRLGAQSLWYDETVSAFLANLSVFDLIGHTARDIHPPGYYLLLHYWAALVGPSEFSLAFFSLIFGLLLIPATYRLARLFTTRGSAPIWAALLVAISPYQLWYSQEVRMYTLGAFLGLVATWSLLKAQAKSLWPARWYWLAYLLCAAAGLYVLYYFAFLLVVINLFFLAHNMFPVINPRRLFNLFWVNLLVLAAYVPWLPIAWRQATGPPVPPWRTPESISAVILESWTALSLGQSVEPGQVWPFLGLVLFLFLAGAYYLNRRSALLLVLYTWGPLLLIQLISFVTPLYHVRYMVTFAPAFYILLGVGLAWLATRTHIGLAAATAALVLTGSLFSIYQFHFSPRYWSDDFRSAVRFIDEQWQPGDIILTNAGYTYPAFVYYTDLTGLRRQRLVPYPRPASPDRPLLLQGGTVDGPNHLGWGDARSDFYAMSSTETETALEALANDYSRLWLLRAYDTVTDPAGRIRRWLAENTTPLEDQLFSGDSSIRVQAFLLNKTPQLGGKAVAFEDGMILAGWDLPQQPWQAGDAVPVRLGWQTTTQPSVDYKMSLKLWAENGELAAQGHDTWPAGTLYRATSWPPGKMVYQPAALTLPPDISPGRYWLNVELYHPDTSRPLPRLDGADPVVTLGAVEITGN